MPKKFHIKTFGCQMNEYDSDKMADVLRACEHMEQTDSPEEADVILFNTCSVREKARGKSVLRPGAGASPEGGEARSALSAWAAASQARRAT